MNRAIRMARRFLRLLPVVLLAGASAQAWAGSADIEGTISYRLNGDRITVEIERIANNTSNVTTGSLYVTVWMTTSPDLYTSGYQVARHRITGSSNGQLEPGHYFSDIRWTLDYDAPPPGTYYVHFYTSQYPEPDTVLDSRTFTSTLDVEAAGGPADIEGTVSFRIEGDRITVEIERIANNTRGTTTGTLYVTVQMTTGSNLFGSGYRVARHRITGDSNGRLEPRHYFSDIQWSLAYQAPPPGTYYVHFYTSQYPEPDTVLDSRTFTDTVDVGGGSGSSDDDHGNSRATATDVSVPSTTSGRIDPATDKDYFRFALSSAGTLIARTSGDLDTVGTLYDRSGERLAEEDDTPAGLNFRIERRLASGTYFVAVESFEGVGNYTLHLSTTGTGSGSPDLAVESPTASVREVAPRGQIVLRATVRNRGNARSPASTIGYYRGRGSTRTLLSEQSLPSLAPSDSRNAELRVNAEAAAGTYTYNICVASVAGESNTSNNCSSSVSVVVQERSGSGVTVGSQRVLGDFDGDGRDDVLLRHADGRWFFYPMNGRRHMVGQSSANLTRNLEWAVAGIGDLNGDGRDDVLLRKPTTGTWYYYPMNGRRHLAGHGAANLPSDLAWSLAGIGDFDGNGRDDVLLRHDDGRWHFYPMNGRRYAAGQGTTNMTRNLEWSVAGVGDLNGDGKDDVLLRKPTTGTWYYYPMNGRRHLAGHGAANLPSDLAWSLAGIGDFDGNGRDDVLLRHDDGRWHFYPMNGRRYAVGQGSANLTRNLEWSVAGIGDLNGDGRDDVLLRKPTTGTWYYYPMNGRRYLTGHGASNLTSDLNWSLAGARVAGGGASGLRISTPVRATVQPFQSLALNMGGGANGAEYDILIDLSGAGSFATEHTIEAAPVKAAGGGLLMAAPLPETLAESNTARRFSVRVRERGGETMSNTLSFTLGETNVPPSLAGHPTVILDVVLKAVYEGSDDPLLTVEAGAIDPGRSVRTARALGLSTAYSDAQAEALLRSLFGASLVATGPSTAGWRTATSARYRGVAVRCEAFVPGALCNAYQRLTNCVGDAIDGFGSGNVSGDSLDRCARSGADAVVDAWDGYGDRIHSAGNFLRRAAPRLARALGVGKSSTQQLFDRNATVRQVIGANKTLRTVTERADDLRDAYESMRDATQALTEGNGELVANAGQEVAADGVSDAERDAYFALVEEADHHQSDAAAIKELEDIYAGKADVVEMLGRPAEGGGGASGNASCGSNYDEFPVDEKTSTCVWNSLVEWNCYAGSRQVNHPDLGDANACLYYSLDFFQRDGTCRENYAKVTFQGRETCRWAELGGNKAAWYTLEKEHGVETPQRPFVAETPTQCNCWRGTPPATASCNTGLNRCRVCLGFSTDRPCRSSGTTSIGRVPFNQESPNLLEDAIRRDVGDSTQ